MTRHELRRSIHDSLPLTFTEPQVAKGKDLASALAAAVVQPNANDDAIAVYKLLQEWPDGLTSTEICTLMKREKLSIRPRISDLFKEKYKHNIGVIYKHPSKLRKPMGVGGRVERVYLTSGDLND
jgi:hypothetical protein